MTYRRSLRPLLSALLLASLATACGGDGDPGSGPPPVPDLRLSDSTATAMTMLVAHVRGGGAGTATLSALIDTAATTVIVIDDSTLAVPVPVLPAGLYQLSLRVGTRTLTAPVRVAAAPTIANPAAYVDSVFTGLGRSLDRQAALFADTATRPAGIDSAAFMQGLQATRTAVAGIRTEFAALSAADQRALAVALRANAHALGVDSLLVGAPAAPALFGSALLANSQGACLGGQACVDVMFQFVEFARDVTIAYIGIAGAVEVGSWFAGPAGKVFAKIATVGLGAGFLYFQLTTLTDQLNRPAAVERVKDPLDEALGIELRSASAQASLAAGDRLTMRASTPRALVVRGEYRSIVAGDAATMPAVATVRDALAGLRSYWNRLAARVPGFSLPAPALASAPRRRVDDIILPQFLRVANPTLAGVTATATAAGTSLAVMLKNDRQGDDHTMSFDLRYVAPGMAERSVTVPTLLYPKEYRVAQLGIEPTEAPVGVRKGTTRQLERIPIDSSGDVIPDSLLVGRATAWSSSRTARATVNGTGLVTGVDTGTVVITAILDGKRAERNVRVSGALTIEFATIAYQFDPTRTDMGNGYWRVSCSHTYGLSSYDPTGGLTSDPPYIRVIGYTYRLNNRENGALLIQETKDIPVAEQWEQNGAMQRQFYMTWHWTSVGGATAFEIRVRMRYLDLRDGGTYETPEAYATCPH